jgi:hypothetical protein
VLPANECVEFIKKIALSLDTDKCHPQTVGMTFSLLSHIYQHDTASKWKKAELFVQISLLPMATKLTTTILYQIKNGSDPNELILNGLVEMISSMVLQMLPLLWYNAQQRTTSAAVKSLVTQVISLLWSPMVLLLSVDQDPSQRSSVRAGLVNLAVPAYFSLLASNHGTKMIPTYEIVGSFKGCDRISNTISQ